MKKNIEKTCKNCRNANGGYQNGERAYFCRFKLNERGDAMRVDAEHTCEKWEKPLPQIKVSRQRKATTPIVQHLWNTVIYE